MSDSTAPTGGIRGSATGPSVPDPAGAARTAGRGRGRRVLKWLSVLLAILVVGTAGAGYAYYRHLNHNIRKGQRSSGTTTVHKAKPNAKGQSPLNILLLGSDGRDTAADLKLGGARSTVGGPARADVEMLLHISADRQHAAVVSIPRDTRVDIPQCTDPKTGQVYPPVNDIINASLAPSAPAARWRPGRTSPGSTSTTG